MPFVAFSMVFGLVDGGGLTLVLMVTISDFVRFLGGEKKESNVRLDMLYGNCIILLLFSIPSYRITKDSIRAKGSDPLQSLIAMGYSHSIRHDAYLTRRDKASIQPRNDAEPVIFVL